jgi:hypothetical protein
VRIRRLVVAATTAALVAVPAVPAAAHPAGAAAARAGTGSANPASPAIARPATDSVRSQGSGTARPGGETRPAGGCHTGTPADAAPTRRYFRDKAYLGPQPLPHHRPVGALLHGYWRLGGMTEATFQARYRDGDQWVYPPDDGFVVRDGRPVEHRETLLPGEHIDRFGYPGGAYLAPTGTPFAQRAMRPQNLDTPNGTPGSNYHEYCVVRPFDVAAGPIAAWFGQPGHGRQFKLDPAYVPAAGGTLSVTWLLGNHYLTEENPAA